MVTEMELNLINNVLV